MDEQRERLDADMETLRRLRGRLRKKNCAIATKILKRREEGRHLGPSAVRWVQRVAPMLRGDEEAENRESAESEGCV